MSGDLAELERTIGEIDALVRPIANRPVDIMDPAWVTKAKGSDPLARAGVAQDRAERLIMAIVGRYATGSADDREAIRAMFRRYPSFAWAVHLPVRSMTAETLREDLLLFSIQDQGQDGRDALLQLRHLIAMGLDARVDVDRLRTDVASLSSDVDRFGMGSTRDMLTGKR